VGVCVRESLCMTLSSTINTMIRSSPACSRKKDNQKRGYMAITGHFIDDSWTLRSCIFR